MVRQLSFPTDEDGFLRRECPFCKKEFKLLFNQQEINELSESSLENFMLEKNTDCENEEIHNGIDQIEFICRSCGQKAQSTFWLTTA